MSPRARIGLLVFAAFGGLFLLVTAGVVALIVRHGRPASSEGEPTPTPVHSNRLAGALYEDGVTPAKESFNRGDQVTVVGRIATFTPANDGMDYLFKNSRAGLESDPKKRAALYREAADMMVEYVITIRCGRNTYCFLMPKMRAAEFEAQADRLTGKRVRATGVVTAEGSGIVPLTDTRIDLLE